MPEGLEETPRCTLQDTSTYKQDPPTDSTIARTNSEEPKINIAFSNIVPDDFREASFGKWLKGPLSISRAGKEVQFCFFEELPIKRRVLDQTLKELPQFLYRVFIQDSPGNNSDGFQSRAVTLGTGPTSFERLSMADVKEQLATHTANIHSNHLHSHWISFTSSFLWAIQRARRIQMEISQSYEHIARSKKGVDAGPLKVLIAMVDTYRLQKRSLIVSAYPALLAYGIPSVGNEKCFTWRRSKSYAEFLVWDEISTEVSIVDISLIKNSRNLGAEPGLLELIPNLKKADKKSTPVGGRSRQIVSPHKLRSIYSKCLERFHGKRDFSNSRDRDESIPLSDELLSDFIQLAKRVVAKPEFQFPMLINLLSLRAPYLYPEDILHGVELRLKGSPMAKGCVFYPTGVPTPMNPEIQVFQELGTKIYQQCGLPVSEGSKRPSRLLFAAAQPEYRQQKLAARRYRDFPSHVQMKILPELRQDESFIAATKDSSSLVALELQLSEKKRRGDDLLADEEDSGVCEPRFKRPRLSSGSTIEMILPRTSAPELLTDNNLSSVKPEAQ